MRFQWAIGKQGRSDPSLWVATALTTFGTALRLRQYFHARSLWLDESMLALNLVDRDYWALLTPLDHTQAAPLGFLWLVKTAILCLGVNELSLRIVPLLAGIAVMPLSYILARLYVDRPASLIALAITTLSPPLVYYSNELKQYSTDVPVAIVLLILGVPLLSRPASARELTALSLAGILATWLSHPSVFILAGVGLALLSARIRASQFDDIAALSVVFLVWFLSFLADYLLSLRQISANSAFQDFWNPVMLPRPLSLNGFLTWVYVTFFESFKNPAGFSFAGLAGSLWLIGLIAIGNRCWRTCLLIVAPLGLTALAAALRLYPYWDRLILFTVPAHAILIGGGVSFLCKGIGPPATKPWVCGIMLFVLLFAPAQKVLREAVRPLGREEVKSALQTVSTRALPGDTLYVFYIAVPAYLYYHGSFPALRDLDIITGEVRREKVEAYLPQLEPLKGRRRVWTLFSHHENGRQQGESAFVVRWLDSYGLRLAEYHFEGAAVYLHDLAELTWANPPSEDPGPGVFGDPGVRLHGSLTNSNDVVGLHPAGTYKYRVLASDERHLE